MPTAAARCLSHNRRAVVRTYLASIQRPSRRFSATSGEPTRPTQPTCPRPTHPTDAHTPGIKGGQAHTGRSLEIAAYAIALCGAAALLILVAFVVQAVAR